MTQTVDIIARTMASSLPSEQLVKTEQLLHFRLAFAAVGLVLFAVMTVFAPGMFDLAALGSSCGIVLVYSGLALLFLRSRSLSGSAAGSGADALGASAAQSAPSAVSPPAAASASTSPGLSSSQALSLPVGALQGSALQALSYGGIPTRLDQINGMLIGLDIFTLTLIVHLSNGVESDLYVLYLLPILLASYTFGKRGTYLSALLVSVCYVSLLVVENAELLLYVIPSQHVTMASAYAPKFIGKIAGRSILLVSVAFIWARFVSYMSGVAQQGANRLREQLENNTRMVNEIQAQAQREALINSINSAIRSTIELDRILETAVDELAGALNVFRCAVVCRLPSEDDGVFICEADPHGERVEADNGMLTGAYKGLSPASDFHAQAKMPKRVELKYFNEELCRFVLENCAEYQTRSDGVIMKTFVYSDPHEEPLFAPVKEMLAAPGYGSLVVQPMMYSGSSKGVLVIAEMDPRRFWSAADLDLIKSVAGQVAVAIEQSSLIQELSKTNQDLVEKNTNLDAINSELRQMQSQLVHQEKMASLGRLVAGIAHELNNPINFVHGNLPYLRDYVEDLKNLINTIDELPGESHEKLARLKEDVRYDFLITDLDNIIADLNEGADRIRQIIRNLRSFSRLDEAELKEASIHEGIESTVKILSQYYGRDKTPLDKSFGTLPNILCYPGQLNQVWMNLLSNAAQAVQNQDDGKVSVSTTVDGGEVIVSIRDNGPGIKQEIQSKIFDPFFTTKPVGQGTGLGLSICHSIVERHGGKIELKSEPGEGTTFTVRLPVRTDVAEFANAAELSIYD